MTKKYRLKKKYESPLGVVHIGVIYTNKEWQSRWFPNLKYEDFDIKDDWFEPITEPERIEVRNFYHECHVVKGHEYVVEVSDSIHPDKFPAIKAVIEQVLNSTTHICKHCNAEVNTPDEDCYKAPSKEKDTLSKDWEILEIRSFNGAIARKVLKHYDNQIGNKGSEYRFVWDGDKDAFGYYEDFILSGSNSIHSVRRLSDNTVWSLKENTPYGEIVEFKITDAADSGMYVLNSKGGWICLSKYQKLPPKSQPLFNWVVFTKEGFGFDTWAKKDWRGDLGSNWDESVKTFVTAFEADEYILMNKPCLSLGDAANVFGGNLTCKNVEDLRNLVKSKQQNH